MKKVFLDSNVLIKYLAGELILAKDVDLCINSVVYSEVLFGILFSGKSEKFLNSHLKYLGAEVLPISQNTAVIFTREKIRLRLKGKRLEDFDILIAASCLEYRLPLWSENKKHFDRIEGISYYK
ncbi:type II toxin-antitoxin system VapC family toxin [bacterium]|nr:type II toxin-antitoxin system VapC family toxin [Candidatus Parcubacteria bacterium]NCT55768.1 type II toxin-antitoxin system VapC family toxin [bacterium]